MSNDEIRKDIMEPTIKQKYHLHQRAEFFVHHDEIDPNTSLEKDVERIFDKQKFRELSMDISKWDPESMKKLSEKKKREKRKQFREQSAQFNATWVREMIVSKSGLQEKMALFWHGHFACKTDDNPYLCIEMANIVRKHALGNFRDLLHAVAQSASMIGYLHLNQNRKSHPNEDFARELCELFTLGRDVDYTEQDIREIARAFTGWQTDHYGKFFFNEKQHDQGEKTIFGKTGLFKGEDVLELILANQKTADYICKKIYRFFVADKVNEDHVRELSDVFYSSNYDISKLMKHLFKVDWFYENTGNLIKGPVELMVGLGKMFDLKFNHEKTVLGLQHYMGQVLFSPPNVAGWAGGRRWVDSSRLALRLRLGSLILNRGYIEDELSPELDQMLMEQQKKQKLEFYEDVDWEKFWKRNEDADILDLVIRSENPALTSANNSNENKTVIHLLSTPDFQLI